MKFGAGSTNTYIYIFVVFVLLLVASCSFSHPPTLLIMKQKIPNCTARWLVKCSNKDSKHWSCLLVPKISLIYGFYLDVLTGRNVLKTAVLAVI